MSIINKILKEFEMDILDSKIKNPETGRDVKVSSALSYDHDSPAYKKAADIVKKRGGTPKTPKEPVDKTTDNKNSRSHKPKAQSFGISKECVELLRSKGFDKLNVLPQSFVSPKDIQFNPTLSKTNKDEVWVCKFPSQDKQGNTIVKTAYTAGFMKKSQVKKYKKISKIKEADIVKLDESTNKLLNHKDPLIADSACVLKIILKTGLRVGSDDNAATGNVGVRTLKVENVTIKGSKIKLDFIGKSYQENIAEFDDLAIANHLRKNMEGKLKSDRLFDCSYGQVGQVMDKINPKGINPKDLRTYKATQTAKQLLADKTFGAPPPLPKDQKDIKKVVKEKLNKVFEAVAKILNNSPSMARNSYVHPVVITDFLDNLGLVPKEVGYKHVTLESKQLKEAKQEKPNWTSMDEMFEKYPASMSTIDDSTISDEDSDDCEEYEIPIWFFDDNWDLVPKTEDKNVLDNIIENVLKEISKKDL